MRYIFFLALTLLFSCSTEESAETTSNLDRYQLGGIGAFSEIVAADVKLLALSSPMKPEDMDKLEAEAKIIAERHNVSVYRESDLLVTDLFPHNVAAGMDVLLIYKGNTIDAYLKLKEDKERFESDGNYDREERLEVARRFGRLLSYSNKKINSLLAENSDFRSMTDFGLKATNVFLYYSDLRKATDFYQNTLGMELLADYEMATIFRMTKESYLILVDATKGMHTADEPKTVALALLTDQLDEWYEHIKKSGVKIKYDYKPKEGGAHDGFVAIDPEGYLLEFERFKQHPENEQFMPTLGKNETVIDTKNENSVPEGLGFHSTITWLYYKDVLEMQRFYEEVIGLELVADQGWTKIYKASDTGFIGLVDERRGMHNFTEKKAVNVSFILGDVEEWYRYVKEKKPFELRSDELGIGPETRYKAFVGYDLEGYYLEFDTFYEHPDNTVLMDYLNQK